MMKRIIKMKRLLTLSILMTISLILQSQTIEFHENFDPPSNADSVNTTSTGSNTWGISNQFSVSGSQSDSCKISVNDTARLTTQVFSATNNNYVLLEFDHISKIEAFDSAMVEVTIDGGNTWVQLDTTHYKGNSSNFGQYGNIFNATAYNQWKSGQIITPTNNWWKHETFNISSIAANQSSVQIRFSLVDGNNGTNFENYGWFLDNIQVLMAPDEIEPPVITLSNPLTDTITTSSGYPVFAEITDQSGIDSAKIIYSIGNYANDTLGMVNFKADSFQANIPFPGYFRKVNYFVKATDASPVHNTDSSQMHSFFTDYIPSGIIDTVLFQSFENGLPTNWLQPLTDDFNWQVGQSGTPGWFTGPNSAHHGINYLFIESQYPNTYGKVAEVITPQINLDTMLRPLVTFYYHMHGLSMGSLHVDIKQNGQWQNDVWTISGQQQNSAGAAYQKVTIDLNSFKDGKVNIRFRAITGNGNYSDIAIDAVTLGESQPAFPDAGIAGIINPSANSSTGAQDVIVKITNYNKKPLSSATVNWKFDNGNIQTYSWTGNLKQDSASASLNLGTVSLTNGYHTIKAWTSNPNGQGDFNPTNDTITNDFYLCNSPLSGAYTLGGANSDFQNFTEAQTALHNCGIDSSVTIQVTPGTYNEQISINSIPGASPDRQVTFVSTSGDSTDVVLQYAPNLASQNYVLKLENAGYLNFEKMTFKNNGASYGKVLELRGDLNHIQFSHSVIEGLSTQISVSPAKDLVTGNISGGDSLTFIRNRFKQGSGALRLKGNIKNIQIAGNTLTNHFSFGIQIQKLNQLKIYGNLIQTPSLYSAYNGISVDSTQGLLDIHNNIVIASSIQMGNGIRIKNVNASTKNPGLVYNNMVSVYVSSSVNMITSGISHQNSRHIHYYFNSLRITGLDQRSSAFHIKDDIFNKSSGIKIANNIMANYAGGTAFRSNNVDSSQYESDYNAFYSSNPQFLMKYDTLNLTRLTNWQSFINKDEHSLEQDPYYISFYNMHTGNNILNGAARAIPSITFDIDGEPRDGQAPDIGADEFTKANYDLALLDITTPHNGCGLSTSEPVNVRIKNTGQNAINNINAAYTIQGSSTIINEQINSSISPGDTLTYTFNSTANLSISSTKKDSLFRIKSWISSSQDSINQNDTLSRGVNSLYQPASPLVSDTIIHFGDSVAITAQSQDSVFWFANDSTQKKLATGSSYNTPTLYDTTTYWAEARSLNPTGSSYCTSSRVAVQVNVEKIPAVESGISHILVNQGCKLGVESVTVEIFNLGKDSILSGFNTHIRKDNNPYISETVGQPIPPKDTVQYTFNSTINLSAPTTDTSFILQTYVDIPGDTVPQNDSLIQAVSSYFTPSAPIVSDTTIPYSDSALLNISSNDSIFWFYSSTSTQAFHKQSSYQTPAIYDTTSYWLASSDGQSQLVISEICQGYNSTGSTPSYPSYLSGDDFVEIANAGTAPVDLTGMTYHREREDQNNSSKILYIDFQLPSLVLQPGEILTLGTHSTGSSVPAQNFYVVADDEVYSSGNTGHYIKDSTGRIVDAVAMNNYTFTTQAGVTPADWSGTIPWAGGTAGIIRTVSDNNTATDWSIAGNPNNQTIGSLNPSLSIPYNGSGCLSSFNKITVYPNNIPNTDALITEITEPNSGIELTNNEKVSLAVFNAGTHSISGFDLSYQVNSKPLITETVSSTIAAGDTLTYTFQSRADLSVYKTHTLQAIVFTAGDTIPQNDTLTLQVKNKQRDYCPSKANSDFASLIADFRLNNLHNNTAGSCAKYSDFTHLTANLVRSNNYPLSVTLGSCAGNFDKSARIFVDWNQDGDFYDKKEDSYILSSTTNTKTYNSQLSVPSFAKTGKTRMRVITQETSQPMSIAPCGTYQNGETEDYTLKVYPEISKDLAVTSITKPDFMGTQNDQDSITARVKNFGTDTIFNFTVHYTLDQDTFQTQVNDTLLTGNNAEYLLTPIQRPADTTFICAWTDLPGDSNMVNNKTCKNIYGEPRIDLKPFYISSLDKGCGLSQDTVKIQYTNLGKDTLKQSYYVKYFINNQLSTTITDTLNADLAPGDTLTHEFQAKVDLSVTDSDSIFEIIAWTESPEDGISHNDSLSTTSYSYHTPVSPGIGNLQISKGANAQITGSTTAPVYWYDSLPAVNPIHIGDTLSLSSVSDTSKYYYKARNIEGGHIKITEIGRGNRDFVEVQNISPAPFDATGWKLILLNSPSNVNMADTITWDLGYFKPGKVKWRDDLSGSGPNYWGSNLSWTTSSPVWIMIVDSHGQIRDFAAFNINAQAIENLQVNAAGFQNLNPANQWSGIGVNVNDTYVKRDIYDTNTSQDWSGSTTDTKGTANPNMVQAPGYTIHICESSLDSVFVYPIQSAINAGLLNVYTNTGCRLNMEPVTIEIFNAGTDTINGNLQASYQLDNNPFINPENIQDTLLPNDTILYTFNTPANLNAINKDTTYQIRAHIQHPSDILADNDTTISGLIYSYSTPPAPSVSDTLINSGKSLTLTAPVSNLNDTTLWYDSDTASTPLTVGPSYQTSLLYDTTEYYVARQDIRGVLAFSEICQYQSFGTGNTSPKPVYLDGDDFVEIMNLGKRPVDLTGKTYHRETNTPANNITYDLPDSTLNPGEVIVLGTNTSVADDPSNNFYSAAYKSVSSDDPTGHYISDSTGNIVEAVALFGYQFSPASGVENNDWSGNIPSGYNVAGVVRTDYGTNSASDWVLSSSNNPQTLGTGNTNFVNNPIILGTGCESQRSSVEIAVDNLSGYDAEAAAIIKPQTGYMLTFDEPVEMQIVNRGMNTLDTLIVGYQLGNQTPVFDSLFTSMGIGDTIQHKFTQTIDLSAFQTYNLQVFVSNPKDTTQANDSILTTITNRKDYCISKANSSTVTNIENVSISTLNNTSTNGTVYSDFTHLPAPILFPGHKHPISVTADKASAVFETSSVKVFIDINKNGQFEPASETFFTDVIYSGNLTVSDSIQLPSGIPTGLRMMRIVLDKTPDSTQVSPCGIYSFGETEDYLIMVNKQIPQDAGVEKITKPDFLVKNSQADLDLVVRNYGLNTLDSINIQYAINNTSHNYVYKQPIASKERDTITLSNVNIPEGNISLCATTVIPNDTNDFNDQTCKNLYRQPTLMAPYYDNFENKNLFLADTLSSTKLWEYGMPAGNQISQAYSGQQVWMTDVDSNYTSLAFSTLTTPKIIKPASVQLDSLSFRHNFHTQPHNDGGYIEYLSTSGQWVKLGNFNDSTAINWYNDDSAQYKPCWSGNSNGWMYSSISLKQITDISAITQFRFVFFSDASNNSEGWAIDNFHISTTKPQRDVAVDSILLPADSTISGTSTNVQVKISNRGKDTLNSIPLAYEYQNKSINEIRSGTLYPDSSEIYQFTQPFISPSTNYTICAYSDLPNDDLNSNDTTCKDITVKQAPIDAGITQITKPGDTVTQFQQTSVAVVIQNFGTDTLYSIPLEYDVNNMNTFPETWSGTLASGDSVIYQFNQSFQTSPGNLIICARTTLPNDFDTTNNEHCKNLISNSLDESQNNKFYVYQNIPNPANGKTRIPYHLPGNGKILFKLRNVIGEAIQQKEVQAQRGDNTLIIETKNLEPGLYFYTIEYKKYKLTRKMIIQ